MVASSSGRAAAMAPVAGAWRGTSECVQEDSVCRDEVNVYRFTEIAGQPGKFRGAGSKIVDGKEIEMGTLEWIYDPDKHALESQTPHGTFRLIVNGNSMEGTLRLADNTLYRRIHLRRSQ
ncbi:MAG TPA: hypothetical protein VK670_06080 [Silvibacterium sp.]|nr:hypothetical protein [Silvibacterium sp.]